MQKAPQAFLVENGGFVPRSLKTRNKIPFKFKFFKQASHMQREVRAVDLSLSQH